MRILGLLLLTRLCFAADFSDFDRFQEKLTREQIEKKLNTFLKRDKRVDGYFELTDEALNVYSALPTQSDRLLEYTLKLAPVGSGFSTPFTKRESLVGLRIAIDPGHFGGPFSRIEERYINIPASFERAAPLQFDEGTLSYLSASYLKVLLEKEGAVVLVTREGVGKGGLPLSFFDWLKENPQLWTPDSTLRKLFKYYNQADLHARAEKINAFQPDLTAVIHFNAHDDQQTPSNSAVTPVNFNLVFVPGAFIGDELSDQRSRYEFMRLLVTEHLDDSLRLSESLLGKFTEMLHIPVVAATDNARYLSSACLKIQEGIYARNLALTRLVHSPLCYGETLIQNNIDECENLSRTDFVIEGIPCSSRIKQVAEAYFEGIKDYVQNVEIR